MRASRFYFSVPENLPAFPAEEQIAWIAVLASRYKGAPMGHRELRQLTGWGGSRADRLLAEVLEWERGKAGAEPGQERGKAGAKPGQERGKAGAADGGSRLHIDEERGSTGAVPGQSRGKAGAGAGQSRGKAGAASPDTSAPPPVSDRSKIDRSEIDRSDSLSPASLSPAPERERPSPRGEAEQPRPAPSAPESAPVAPAGGSGRGEAVAAPEGLLAALRDVVAERLPERLVAALRAAGLTTEAQVAAATDRELRFLPGIGEAGLATIRRAIPATGTATGTATATATGTGTATGTDARREAALERAERTAGLLGLNRKKKTTGGG